MKTSILFTITLLILAAFIAGPVYSVEIAAKINGEEILMDELDEKSKGHLQEIDLKIYEIKGKKAIKRICHYDLYRISNPRDVLDLAVEDYFHQPDTICFVEWPKKAKKYIPPDCIKIFFQYGDKKNERIIEIKNTSK